MQNSLIHRACLGAATVALLVLLPATLLAQKGAPGPTNVTVVSNGASASVSWTPVSSRGVTYRVLRAPNARERGVDLTDPIEDAKFDDSQVEPGATYFYQVVAVFGDGSVAAAAPVGFTVPTVGPGPGPGQGTPLPDPLPPPKSKAGPAPAPGNPGVAGNPAAATISWAAVPGASGYTVERWSQVNPACCRAASPVLPANATSWADSNYPLEGNYTFRITALYPDGGRGSVDVNWLRPAPQDPAGFNAVFVNGTTVKLTWQAVPGVARYLLGGPGTDSNVPVSGTTVSVAGVPAGRQSWTVFSLYEPGGVFTKGVQASANVGLRGWVDLHTHPMSNLAFGGKLFHGAPDAGSLMPAIQMPYDPQCRFDVRAANVLEALSDDAPTHGDPVESKCGSIIRKVVIRGPLEQRGLVQPGHAVGAPTFANWPAWNDMTHQKMWWEWIKRAHDGGLRVMVALSHNNRTLGDVLGPGNFTPSTPGGAISGPTDDMRSSDLQIAEIKAFVGRHQTFMQLAFNSADVYNIVKAGKLAVVLGVELDNIGNFNQRAVTPALIQSEILRLFNQGVRYVFPIHVTDNVFGDTAIYDELFSLANARETGQFWKVDCAAAGDNIGFRAPNFYPPPPWNVFIPNGLNPPQAAPCMAGAKFLGHVNVRNPSGLTQLGGTALRSMMKLGMIIDIDHMSNRAVNSVLQIAKAIPFGGYPLVSGHTGIRDGNKFNTENARTSAQLQEIGCLQGMFGVGTAEAEASDWAAMYARASGEIDKPFTPNSSCASKASWFGPGGVAFGTDINSLLGTPRPPRAPQRPLYGFGEFPTTPMAKFGNQKWNYLADGVAHYGMFADFVKYVRSGPVIEGMNGTDLVDNHLMASADYFWRMWQKIEAQKVNVP